ncbi:MAG: NADH-quinone oxidoreductase subunit NuoB [Candidatus Omnitrophica bacterium]|nr:NADH-quinone oxidoreductase subunit NuoB [Candidatus Omnitrophota bacterium]
MLKILATRVEQGCRTLPFPSALATLPERFRGRPTLDHSKCPDGCQACADACPVQALQAGGAMQLDLGRCLFCRDCLDACPEGAIAYTRDYRLASTKRQDLVLQGDEVPRVHALDQKMRKLFGRSLKLREVCAGSCNGCEMELQALNNVVFDLGRFGVQFVASPRHADGLIVTGPVTENMRVALLNTYEAIPSPKLVIAVGACAISGGPFRDSAQVRNGVEGLLPVDLYLPGCPPHPLTLLDGLLRLLGRIEDQTAVNYPRSD